MALHLCETPSFTEKSRSGVIRLNTVNLPIQARASISLNLSNGGLASERGFSGRGVSESSEDQPRLNDPEDEIIPSDEEVSERLNEASSATLLPMFLPPIFSIVRTSASSTGIKITDDRRGNPIWERFLPEDLQSKISSACKVVASSRF